MVAMASTSEMIAFESVGFGGGPMGAPQVPTGG